MSGVTSENVSDKGPSEGGLEARLKRLEEIVAHLDSDGIELEEALRLFEEGVGHVRSADDVLAKAELKVEELIGAQGQERRPFPVESDNHGGNG